MNLRSEHLTDYLHDALSIKDKQQVEALIRTDPDIRARVADMRQTKLWLEDDLRLQLDGKMPPATMSFDAIAGRVQKPRRAIRTGWKARWAANLSALAALFILSFAIYYSLGDSADFSNDPQYGNVLVITATPTAPVATNEEGVTIPTATPTPVLPTVPPNSSIPTRVFSSIPTRTTDQ